MSQTNLQAVEAYFKRARSPLARQLKTAYITAVVEELAERMPAVTGQARANIHVTAGGPAPAGEEIKSPPFRTPDATYVEAVMEGSTADSADHVDLLGHAAIIAPGRREGKKGMLGSEQYPNNAFIDAMAAAKFRLAGED